MALLKNRGKELDVLGHDKDFGQAGLARKMGAITKVERNLHSACEKADMIVLAIPTSEIKETLELIAEDLKTGCVITDTASLKAPILEWADECLPESVSFVGGDPILFGDEAGLDMARPDLFEKKQYCLTPSVRATADGVKLVTDLVSMMGAIPHFIDPHEHDGLIGGSEHLADILAVTLLQTLSGSGGWRDMRRICGATFDRVTCFSMSDPAEYRDRALYNRENVMRWIDTFQRELSQIRQTIEQEDGDTIEEYYDSQMDARIKWLHDRDTQDWGDMPRNTSMPTSGSMMSQMLFGGLGRRRSEDE
jgi:prephenate dehydrogenase